MNKRSNIIKKIWAIISLPVFIFSLNSLLTAQEHCESNAAGKICCEGGLRAFDSIKNGKFIGRCIKIKGQALLRGNEREFEADYASQVTGRVITVEELEQDETLREGLINGRIVTAEGEIITFTPLNEIKKYIRENPTKLDQTSPESRFEQRRDLDGFEKALEEYMRTSETPDSTPVRTDFLLRIGNEYLQTNDPTKAIKIYRTILDFNPDSVLARVNLANAHQLNGNTRKAIENFEKVLRVEALDERVRLNTELKINELKSVVNDQ